MNAGQIVVIALSVAIALWIVGGIWYNRRRARQIWRWLEPGLDVFGGQIGEVQFAKSGAGLRVAIDEPVAPLGSLDVIVSLLSRENLPLWLFELSQGKRDQLTFRVSLRAPGRGEIEMVPVGSRLDRALQAQSDHPWRCTKLSPRWVIAQRGNVKSDQITALQEFIDRYSLRLQRFSKRRSEPHLFVQIALSDLAAEDSRQLLNRVNATFIA